MSFTRRLRAACAAVLFLLAAAQPIFAAQNGHPKVDRALRDSPRSGAATQHVIIRIKAGRL